MPSFQLTALWESPCWSKTVLSLVCFIDATTEMGTNAVSLCQAAGNKVPKDTI